MSRLVIEGRNVVTQTSARENFWTSRKARKKDETLMGGRATHGPEKKRGRFRASPGSLGSKPNKSIAV